jgi:hypothetical protein
MSTDGEAGQWSLVVPSRWNGPVDDTLPSYARIETLRAVRICPRDGEEVLILWRRTSDMRKLWWDKNLRRWRTDLENQPQGNAAESPDALEDEGIYDPDRDFVSRDEVVGACIVDQRGNARRFMLPDVGTEPACDDMLLGPVVCRGDRWEVALGVYPPHPQGQEDTSSKKLQLVPVSWHGWGTPVAVSGSERIYGPFTAMAAQDGQLDLFLDTMFLPFGGFTFPDSGLETTQLVYLRIKDGRIIERRPVYTQPLRTTETDHQLLAASGRRYDLLFRRRGAHRSPGPDEPDELVHVANLLGWWPRRSTVAQMDGLRDGPFVAVVRGDQAIQVVWLKGSYDEEGPHPESRLFEAHQQGAKWTAPRELFVRDVAGVYSLAAATAKSGDQELVVVVWCGLDGNLVYCLSPDADTWTTPQATQLALGPRNFLVFAGDRMVLVSEFHNNLYWCHIGLVRAGPLATQNVDRPPVRAEGDN